MRTALIALIFCLSAIVARAQKVNPEQQQQQQQQDLEIIKAFLQDVVNPDLRSDVILSQHVLLEKAPSNDNYDYLEASIDEIRLNFWDKDFELIEYLPFNKLPRKETRDIDPEGKATDKMYFIRYNNRQLLAIYLDKDKIASFTLVSKGNNVAHFVTY